MLIKRLVVGQLQANCYIVVDEATSSAAVIDPGDDAPAISRILAESGASLGMILLTHGHPDHSFAAGRLQEEFPDASALMHASDVDELSGEGLDIAGLFYDIREHRPFRPTGYVKDGDHLEIGRMNLAVIHTPGHTPGGVCYLAEGAIFTGDTIFASGIGRTDLPGGSYEQLLASIRDRILTLPDETVIYPGHGQETTVGIERRDNPWLG